MSYEKFSVVISEMTGVQVEDIKETSSFRDDLSVDSLQMVNLLIQLTERFGTSLDQIMISDDLFTVGGLYKAMQGGNLL